LGEYEVETTCEQDCGQSNQETEGETTQTGDKQMSYFPTPVAIFSAA